MRPIWIRTALFNFLIAAVMGAVMRFAFVQAIPGLHFKAFLHGHSHGAMLGWIYLALYSLMIPAFLKEADQKKPIYAWVFWTTQVTVLGMFVSFPIQGYGPVSIFFSTLHILLSYLFAGQFLRDLRGVKGYSAGFIRLALFWMVVSTLGVWAMGPLMGSSFRGSAWYYLSVQFFLHFQFNGWFLFGALALFFRWLENRGIELDASRQQHFRSLLIASTILTFALAVAWSNPHPAVFALNSMGVLIQLAALWVLRKTVVPALKAIRGQVEPWTFGLWRLALLSFIGKVLIQAAVVVPAVAKMAYTIRNFVIGFVHLIMLGVLSMFIFAYLDQEAKSWFSGKATRLGISVFVVGVALSEALLFLQGTLFWLRMGFLPHYYLLLFAFSALMPVGVGVVWVGAVRRLGVWAFRG